MIGLTITKSYEIRTVTRPLISYLTVVGESEESQESEKEETEDEDAN